MAGSVYCAGMQRVSEIYIASALLFASYLVVKLINWYLRIRTFLRTMPVIPLLFPPASPIRRLFPRKYQTFHYDWYLQSGGQIYRNLGSDVFAFVCLFEFDSVCTRDPDAFVQVKVTSFERFPRALEQFKMVSIYGPNVVTTEGEEWKHHRRIMSRAFSPKNVQLVQFETARQTGQMLTSWETKLKENCNVVEDVHHQTMTLAFHIILSAGYGYTLDWDAKDEIWKGHRMALKDSIRSVINNLFVFIVLPPAVLKYLPFKYFQALDRSYEESKMYFKELIDLERRGKLSKSAGPTFLSSLVENSNESKPGIENALTEEEIVGNVFLFFIAGHESTAKVLMYGFYLLALHPEVQQDLYEEVQRVCGNETPGFAQIPDLVYVLCVAYETMRLFPVVGSLRNRVSTDQTLLGRYKIPSGTYITLDLVNTQRNEKHWGENMDKFDPSRFLDRSQESIDISNHPDLANKSYKLKIPARGTFVGFSDGPTACLGIFLASNTLTNMVVQKYSIHLKDGWTKDQVWQKLHESTQLTTINLQSPIPLVFRRR